MHHDATLLHHLAERRFAIFSGADLVGQLDQRFASNQLVTRLQLFNECATQVSDRRLLLAAAVLITLVEDPPGGRL